MTSLYETNILNQPSEWKRILSSPIPTELKNLQANKITFIGIGSSYWVARFAEFLWRDYNTRAAITPSSLQSFDFVRSKYVLSKNDIVVVFSHRGTKIFSMKALEIAKESGATTVLVTGIGSPLTANDKTDFQIETCPQENCGAFTISLTSAITRIIQWIGMYNVTFLERFKDTTNILEKVFPFKVHLPKFFDKLVIVGDLIREIIAHEVALKISDRAMEMSECELREYWHMSIEFEIFMSRAIQENKIAAVKHGIRLRSELEEIFQSKRKEVIKVIEYYLEKGCSLMDILIKCSTDKTIILTSRYVTDILKGDLFSYNILWNIMSEEGMLRDFL